MKESSFVQIHIFKDISKHQTIDEMYISVDRK